MIMRWGFALAFMLAATAAHAQEYRLKTFAGASNIIVWQSKDAQSEGMKLIEAGVHKTKPELIMRLVSCIAAPGTKVIVTDMGIVTHDIMIVEGKQAGCKGNIPAEELAH